MPHSSVFWGITTFFNPGASDRRLANYRRFREHSLRQGMPLVTVELAFGEAPFELGAPHDADILVQRRSTSVLWQKERLLNLALAALPERCEGVCWADADVLFEDDNWIEETQTLLRDHVILQPFSAAVRLPKDKVPSEYPGGEVGRTIEKGTDTGTYSESVCSALSGWLPSFSGTTGYAWCARRSFLDEIGFYDRCIVGGGDRELALAFAYAPGKAPKRHVRIHHGRLRDHIRIWQERVHSRAGRCAYRRGVLHHLWHGDPANRNYVDRHAILEQFDFDPERDLALDDGGCWQWATGKTDLVDAVRRYFEARSENE
jgi:hypothetical protein